MQPSIREEPMKAWKICQRRTVSGKTVYSSFVAPGSGKTEMANFLDKHPAIHIVDNLTLEVEKEKMWRLTDKTRADIRESNIFDLQGKRSKVKAKDRLEEVEGW